MSDENKPEYTAPQPPAADTPAVENSATVEATTEIPAATESPTVEFTVSGVVSGTAQVPVGWTVKQAIAKISENSVNPTNFVYRDAGAKVVAADRKLTQNLAVTSVAKAAGG